MWNCFQKQQGDTGEWRTSSTGIWILHLRMITIQQQKKHADVKEDSTGNTAHCTDIVQPEPEKDKENNSKGL